MRGLIVFNESSGVSFYSVDEEFRLFLQHRLKETGAGPDVPVCFVLYSCIYIM